MAALDKLEQIARAVRYFILECTTEAGSGHPTSSLSATDLAVGLFFHKLRFDLNDLKNPNNDRVIFSKGHVSPLIYSLYKVAGAIDEKELLTYRKFQSPLEGHPTPKFKYSEVATGSLGQGLSNGLGMAINSKYLDKTGYMTYVLMGDSEMAEGSVWEAMEVASYYKLGNLVGIVDVNRLGQSGETMLGWDTEAYKRRAEAFGWETHVLDGNKMEEVVEVLDSLDGKSNKPQLLIAKTVKGKGVSFLEDKDGWHGKALGREDFEKAIGELKEVDKGIKGEIAKPTSNIKIPIADIKSSKKLKIEYKIGDEIATRKAYGETLAKLGAINPSIVCLDAEVKNSTFSEIFKEKFPERFFEMFVAEQNMVGTAAGLAVRGKVPFVSTFSAFFTRAFDQIRMSAYSGANIKFMGSHTGVSIGEDGTSQMGLEDIAMFCAIFGSKVVCPSDGVSCAKLTEAASLDEGIYYIRTARPATKVIYSADEEFKIGGSKILKQSKGDKATIVACGVTVYEALEAAKTLEEKGIAVCVVDAYSIKPIDAQTLKACAGKSGGLVICVEDHYSVGGLGDAVLNVFADGSAKVVKLAVYKLPMSGKGNELLDYEEISAGAIVKKVEEQVK